MSRKSITHGRPDDELNAGPPSPHLSRRSRMTPVLRPTATRSRNTRPGGSTEPPGVDRFYRTLAHEAPDAIVYADSEGLIAFWNKGAERLFGFSAAEAMGKPLDIIIPERFRRRHWRGYTSAVRTGKLHYGAGDLLTVPALRKDGACISVEFTIVPFWDRAGRILGIAATLRDVTRHHEQMKALRKAAASRPRTSHQP
jgi:PAS domain S-box-containing protein